VATWDEQPAAPARRVRPSIEPASLIREIMFPPEAGSCAARPCRAASQCSPVPMAALTCVTLAGGDASPGRDDPLDDVARHVLVVVDQIVACGHLDAGRAVALCFELYGDVGV